MLDKKLTLASLLCKPFQYSLIELQILRREASHRLLFRWQFNLSVKKVRLIFPPAMDHGLTDAIFSGDFRVIFNSFCFGDYIKFKHEVVRRVTSLGHDDNLTWNKRLQYLLIRKREAFCIINHHCISCLRVCVLSSKPHLWQSMWFFSKILGFPVVNNPVLL